MPYCMMPMADYIHAANEETFIVVQIEDEGALSQVDAIAAVDGVDVLFFGPADFSVLGGIAGQFDHPRISEAIRTIAAAARRAGKHWGMPSGTVERTQQLLDLGARFLCHGADIIFVKNGLEEMQRRFAPLGFTFGAG